jgi:nicotinic acid phosphoribosyltransferase
MENELRKILKATSEVFYQLSVLNEQDFENLMSGEFEVRIINNKNKRNLTHITEKNDAINIKEILETLKSLSYRDEANRYLQDLKLKKVQMHDILRELDINFTTKDKNERLSEKIIEGTIGFRLRSEAIRKTDLRISK